MNILVVHKNKNLKHKKELENFISKYSHKTDFVWKNILKPDNFKNQNLIISIGGDGTFLSASHFTTNQSILGVNLNHKNSEGALTTIKLHQLENKLKKIFTKKFKIKKYQREIVKIFKKDKCIKTELALNETFFGNINPHHPSNYLIQYKNKKEAQSSSGILISTGTGSTAWYKASGGFPFSKTKSQLRFRIRELYKGRIHKPKIKKGKIKQNKKLTIISKMNHGILSIDSIRNYTIHKNNKIEISLGLALKVIQ